MSDPPGQRREPVDCLLDARLDDEDLLDRGDEDAAPDERRHRLQREEAAASASWTRRDGSAHRRERPDAGRLCPLVINQTITYVDRGHVSQTYARELAQPFRTAFRAELFR